MPGRNSAPTRETILVISASLTDPRRPLRGDREISHIRGQLRRSNERDRYHLETREAIDVDELSQALLDLRPTIVHFSGHGIRGEGIVLEGPGGMPHTLRPETLAAFLAPLSTRLRAVVLNACATETLVDAIVPHVEAVVGMDKAISDVAGVAFSKGFYQALGAGQDWATAVHNGKAFIGDIGSGEHDLPTLTPGAKFHLSSSPPAVASADRLPERLPVGCFLPTALADFTGRRVERDELNEQLCQGTRRVTIAGMGGAGKTQLAIRCAHDVGTQFPDGVLFVDLLGMLATPLTPEDVAERVVHAFDPLARPATQESWLDLYRNRLASRQCLLVLDNAKDQAAIKPLIPPPPVGLLVTARRRIHLPGSQLRDVAGLSEGDAKALVRTILGPVTATETQLEDLITGCGALPLALRAAATSIVVYNTPLDDYLARLQQARQDHRRLDLLSQPGDIDDDLDVRAVLMLSLDRLLEDNRGLARRYVLLTEGPSDFALGEAMATWNLDRSTTLVDMDKLVARSLVERDPHNGRFRIHDLLREMAWPYLVA